jgi:hypothetical protein
MFGLLSSLYRRGRLAGHQTYVQVKRWVLRMRSALVGCYAQVYRKVSVPTAARVRAGLLLHDGGMCRHVMRAILAPPTRA